jgi:hypothetical protein
MNKAIYVILIAIIATLVSTMVPLFLRDREVSPTLRRLLWVSFLAGMGVLLGALVLVFTN